MLDKSIDSALLALRKNLIRGCGEGLHHVEALLTLRGVVPPAVLPAKRKDVALKGHMAMWVQEALQGGPKPFADIVAHVAIRRPEIGHEAVYRRTGQALDKLKRRGLVRLEELCDHPGWNI